MTVDPINNKEKLFPTYSGSNDSLYALLTKTSQIICKWFSDAEKSGPLPMDINFKCSIPDEFGKSSDVLFSEIESLIYSSFNPAHPRYAPFIYQECILPFHFLFLSNSIIALILSFSYQIIS